MSRTLWHRLGGARAILLASGAVVVGLVLVAWATGQTGQPLFKLFLLLPLLAGLLGLTRLRRAHLLAPTRSTLAYGLSCLALVAWGLSGLWNFFAVATQAAAQPFPSLGDLGYFTGGLFWAAAIWILYEGVTPDFLSEIEANAFLLSWMSIATIFVLSVAGGADLLEAIKAGGNTLQIVALAYPLNYSFNVVMLLRLVHGQSGAGLTAERRPLTIIVVGLLLIYLAQVTWSTTVIQDHRLSGEPVARTSGAPQVLYALAYVVVTLGVASYPLPGPRLPPQSNGAIARDTA